jgi:hypothetical protein
MSDPLATNNLALPYIAAAQAQKHVTHNEALRKLDTLVQLAVLDASRTTPPGSPGEGDRYIVAGSATDAWSGHDADVATWVDGVWEFAAPGDGWLAYDIASEAILVCLGGAWAPATLSGPFDELGVNTTADATNRLAVRSDAVLFTAIDAADGGDGDVRFTVNKETDGDTASLLFQSGWSGRAEVGLAGDTDLVVKVSSDGTAWTEAIRIDKDTGIAAILYDNGTSGLTATTVQGAIDEIAAGGGGGGGAVVSVFGRTGTVTAAAGDYAASEVDNDSGVSGATVKDALDTLDTAIGGKQDADADLADIAALSPSNDDVIQRKAGAWANRTIAQLKTDLTLTKSDVGLGSVTDDAQLKAASNLSDLGSASTARTNLGVAIGSDVQAYDADLGAIAALSPSNDDVIQRKAGAWVNRTPAQLKTDLALTKSDVGLGSVTNDAQLKAASNLSDLASASTARTNLGVAIGSDVQAYDADLGAIAALSPSNDDVIQRKAGAWANRTIAQLKTDLALTKSDVGLGSVTDDAQPKIASNLADIPNAGAARTNLGLGDSATKNTGTSSGTVAAGDDSRITNAAAKGANADITSLSALAGVNSGALRGFTNLLINPDGRINQRAPSSNADDTYGHDRWVVLTQTNAIAVSTQTDVENGTPRMWRLSQSQATAQRMGYAQIIEGINCKHLRGKQVTLGGRIRYSNNAAVRYAILEWTSTEDTVTSDVVNSWTNGTFTAGNFFKSTTQNVLGVGSLTPAANTLTDLTALTVTVGSSCNNLIVFIWTEGTAAQNSTFDGALQLEAGAVASAREFRPIGTEVAFCQRYFCKSYAIGTAPGSATNSGILAFDSGTSTTNAMGVQVRFPVEMRAAPTLVTYDEAANSGKISRGGNNKNGTSNDISSSGLRQYTSDATNASWFSFHYTADAEL